MRQELVIVYVGVPCTAVKVTVVAASPAAALSAPATSPAAARLLLLVDYAVVVAAAATLNYEHEREHKERDGGESLPARLRPGARASSAKHGGNTRHNGK